MTLHFQRALGIIIIWVMAAVLSTGCSTATKQPANESEPTPIAQPAKQKESAAPVTPAVSPDLDFVHTVKWPGETLSFISKWYTGRYANWLRLAKANPDINPNLIRKGDKIIIPERLLKRRTPMPKNFATRLAPKKKSKTKVAEPTQENKTQEEEQEKSDLPLFGPK